MALAGSADGPLPKALGAAYIRDRATALLHVAVGVWVFSGGFVINEPAPYELLFLIVLVVGAFGGWVLRRNTAALLALFFAFVPFALAGAFQVRFSTVNDALVFVGVTIFLFFTACFSASYVAEAPQARMRLIVKAYIASAVVTALLGIGGYLGVIPGGEALFTRYGRAKGAFQDPNVFAPYLILPAMYLLQRMLLGTTRRTLWAGALFMVLLVGVFTSFSRAAWGSMAAGALFVIVAVFFLEAHAREKVRILILSIAGTLMIVVAIGGLLSIPSVQKLFDIRAADQAYDEGETGRFGRQGYAFELALQHPLGLGPQEFRNLHVREEPHDTYVTVLHSYGWGGGMVFYVMLALTVWRGTAALFRPSPNRLLLIPLMAAFVPLVIEAAIIDIDHWRHLYLLAGLIWGVTAGYGVTGPGEQKRLAALI
jgi:O-antigen ligase